MKQLKNILFGVAIEQTFGSLDKQISTVVYDSRKVETNSVFVAIKGDLVDGHDYIDKAFELGATIAIVEDQVNYNHTEITLIRVQDTRIALAVLADNYYENPSRNLELIGITGTNGKTTIASLCFELFSQIGYASGLLSTVAIKYGNHKLQATHTTPDPLEINKHLSEMVILGISHCFMEVSSHGIHQKRIYGLNFRAGVFTNLTRDHLDYHETFSDYRDTKKSFFDMLPKSAFALVNGDDKNAAFMLQNTKAKKNHLHLKIMQIIVHKF